MEARSGRDGTVTIQMSEAEAVVLHAAIASSEFENELTEVELREPVEKMVFSEVQQALAPLIPGLGSDEYGATVARAFASIDPGPF